ncbi:O-methyltransferase-domain-containing protein [Parachaetomium inaequale]|uniref:O-methyltransferase-domain-containing protein n=1 Tax=Parachaetomium inaequale TaxID=2588326 RepID=A0AAN6PIP9_9PEZI|nr:O-methyltransferase-domain-containing protein [Parachaetomium inaequale]
MASAAADTLEALAEMLTKAAKALRSGSLSLETDIFQRMGLIQAGTDLINAVSLPKDKTRLWFPQLAHFTAIRMFIKWRAFEKIPVGDGAAISYTDLAAKLGGDVSLITRFARVLVANGSLKQVGGDSVAHTELSQFLSTENPFWAMVQVGFDNQVIPWAAMPRYFDQFGISTEPTDRLQTIVAFAEGRLGATVWDINHSTEERLRVFMLGMAFIDEHMPPLGVYDLGWAAKEAAKESDRVLVVDVGGGRGQALKGILKVTPWLPAHRCVLEDLPEVVEAAKRGNPELADVQMVVVDFFKEQPVRGALVYYIRGCLQDYSDEDCVRLLQQISGAMAADSRLLIVETLLGDQPSALQAALDLAMMAISGKQRTLDNFRDITGKAALEITKVCQIPNGSAVIECAPA